MFIATLFVFQKQKPHGSGSVFPKSGVGRGVDVCTPPWGILYGHKKKGY